MVCSLAVVGAEEDLAPGARPHLATAVATMGAGAGEGAGPWAPQAPHPSRRHLRPQQGPLLLPTVAACTRGLLTTAEGPGGGI